MADLFDTWVPLGISNFISPFEFSPIISSVPREASYFKISFSSQWNEWENNYGGGKLRSFLKLQERYSDSSKSFIYEEKRLIPSSCPVVLFLPPAPGNNGVRSFYFKRFFWSHRWAKNYSIPENPNLIFPLSVSIEVST